MSKFRLIDLFCGAGGMSLGFSSLPGTPFSPVWANDFNDFAARTYNAHFGKHCTTGDIREILDDPSVKIPEADVVIGGPPCQGFSLLNKNRNDDPRRSLWMEYFSVVERSGAKVFVMENVIQLLGSPEYLEIAATAEAMGFRLSAAKLLAADYGVPQRRWRAFIVGSRKGDPREVFPPPRTNFDPNGKEVPHRPLFDRPTYLRGAQPWATVRSAIGDLEPPTGTEIRSDAPPPMDLHFGRNPTQQSIERYKTIPNEGENRFDLQRRAPNLTPACWIRKKSGGTDLFGRLWWDRPAFTIRTEFFKPEKGRYLHPDQHRPITHREAARLQSFPDTFRFKGTKTEIAKQIGNAVPPTLAGVVAESVHQILR